MEVQVGCSPAERIECPICCGRGTTRGRAFRRSGNTHVCGLCHGAGSVTRAQIADLPKLCLQMQRVADLMQAGDADEAATAFRVALRIARSMIANRS